MLTPILLVIAFVVFLIGIRLIYWCLEKNLISKIRTFRVWYCTTSYYPDIRDAVWGNRHMDIKASNKAEAIKKVQEILKIQTEREIQDLGLSLHEYYGFFAREREDNEE